MNMLNLSSNLVRFRRERKITQEQLAEFIGVTKASVSKWETGQSTPDIMILPQLAAYFDVTIDELIGYAPQLSKEQIQKLYQDFAKDFSCRPFAEVLAKTQTYVKQYYSCYPFLSQICALWLNHFTLAEDPEKRREVLSDICDLCEHIKKHCKNISIYNDMTPIQSVAFLQLGRTQDVIDLLEDSCNPVKLSADSHKSLLLSQAYLLSGNIEKADSILQISMYDNILSLLGNAANYLAIHVNDLNVCEQTIARIGKLIEAYHLPGLHPNNTASFEYQAAICYLAHNKKEEALTHAANFVTCLSTLFADWQVPLHGDDYFIKIEPWFAMLDNGAAAPRSKSLVLQDIAKSFDHPAFTVLQGDPAFEKLKRKLKELTQ